MAMLPFPSWALMWLIALALYGTAKCATLATHHLAGIPLSRKAAYLLLFPGMDADAFCTRHQRGSPADLPGLHYLRNVVAGAALLWGVARLIPTDMPLVRGWIGMTGLVLLLHFGLLQLVTLAWRAAGFDAPPLMNEPIRSASIAEFWGVRWNTAFRCLSHQFIFQPLIRRTGPRAAMFLTFAFSGVVHDLVISLPAGAGFGLPTAYFLIQGAGLLFERTNLGRHVLRRRAAARCFAIAVVGGPVPLLFHSAFLLQVFVPFMVAIGALPKEVIL